MLSSYLLNCTPKGNSGDNYECGDKRKEAKQLQRT